MRADYEAALRNHPTSYSLVSTDREREAVVAHVPASERISERFFASNLADETGRTIVEPLIVLTTDAAMWTLSATGVFRKRVEMTSWPYAELQNRVAAGEMSMGATIYVARFVTRRGDTHLLSFREEDTRDALVHELQAHLRMWHEIRPQAPRDPRNPRD